MKSSYTLEISVYQLVTYEKCKMAVKTHALFYMRDDGEGANICVQIVHFFVGCNASVLPLQHFNFVLNQIVVTTMKRMLNKMLRYADAIVKRGVDKLIDAIGHSAEPQSEKTETPQPQKRMGNDTDCGLTEQTITLMDEQCNISYNVLDRTLEMKRRDQADKGFVPVSKLVRNTMVTAPFYGAESDEVRRMRAP